MSTQPATTDLTGRQLVALLGIAGLEPGQGSPLVDLAARSGASGLNADDVEALQRSGILTWARPRQVAAGVRSALEVLCRPARQASLILGTRDQVGTLHAFSRGDQTDSAVVGFTAEPERDLYHLSSNLSFHRLADLITAQVLFGPLKDTLGFSATCAPAEFAALLGILDWRLHSVLAATLDRDPVPEPVFTSHAIWQMLVQGRTARDLGWHVTLFMHLLPVIDYGLDEAQTAEAVRGLAEQHLVLPTADGRNKISEPLLELADGFAPVVSFAGVHLRSFDLSTQSHSKHLVILRGRLAILLVEPVITANGARVIAMDGIDEVELAEVLFDLGLSNSRFAATARAAAAEPKTCPVCGDKIQPGDKFCARCGAPFTLPR